MTSLYNIACCHSKLGDARSGLVALAGKDAPGTVEQNNKWLAVHELPLKLILCLCWQGRGSAF
eukprot:scaffold294101_cov17-Tisochrysis_lutea.AAC.1